MRSAGYSAVETSHRGDEGWHVLADPEGNEFCLLRSRLT
ncbi:MAG: VOC family protein [Streptosporangiaceae bacterium]